MLEIKNLPENYNRLALIDWLADCTASLSLKIKELTYILVGDEEILRINRDFLQHNYYTDIITFNYNTSRFIRGEVYISIDTVKSNAQEYGHSVFQELCRVLAHGLLHLAGYDDQNTEQQAIMTKMENYCLHLRPENLTA
jgi:probable rRNA maturation factor